MHTHACARMHTEACAPRYIPTIYFRKEKQDNRCCLSRCPERCLCVFPECHLPLVNLLIYFIQVKSSLHPQKWGDFIFVKFQAGRKPGSRRAEGRERGSGLGFPSKQPHRSIFSVLCGPASVFTQPLFISPPRLHTVARLGNFSSWNIHEKSSAPLS